MTNPSKAWRPMTSSMFGTSNFDFKKREPKHHPAKQIKEGTLEVGLEGELNSSSQNPGFVSNIALMHLITFVRTCFSKAAGLGSHERPNGVEHLLLAALWMFLGIWHAGQVIFEKFETPKTMFKNPCNCESILLSHKEKQTVLNISNNWGRDRITNGFRRKVWECVLGHFCPLPALCLQVKQILIKTAFEKQHVKILEASLCIRNHATSSTPVPQLR